MEIILSPTEKKVTKGVVAYPFVFAKIQPQNYRFSLFSNPQTFLLYTFFRFQDGVKTLV